jgi:hypothetical protein
VALADPRLDGRLSRLASALALMGETFARWCGTVLEQPPRRLAAHLQALAAALYVSPEAVRALPGSAYDPAVLDRLLGPRLDRACVERHKRSPLPPSRPGIPSTGGPGPRRR